MDVLNGIAQFQAEAEAEEPSQDDNSKDKDAVSLIFQDKAYFRLSNCFAF